MPGQEVAEFFVANNPLEHRRMQQEAWNEYRNCNGLQSKTACSQSTGIVTPFWGCLRYQLYLHKI